MRMKVLLAEDDPHIARLVAFKLEKEGFWVTIAEDGKRALERARSERFDLILLDILMPVLDGLRVLQELQRDPQLQGIPVVMLSAKGHEKDVERALSRGAVDYIVKPFHPQELVERVREALQSRWG